MTIEINGNRLTLNNVDPFRILILLGDKVVDKSVVKGIATPNFSVVVSSVPGSREIPFLLPQLGEKL